MIESTLQITRGSEDRLPPAHAEKDNSSLEPLADRLIADAHRRLDRERARGYSEATHRMIFPHSKGFTGESEFQRGDVFARAILADALCDSRDAGYEGRSDDLKSECDYLVQRRQRSACGGWSYFPELPELPPDVDVLAEVMQVLVRCNWPQDWRTHVEPPLRLVLKEGVTEDGAIGTWIVPRANRTPLEERQAAVVERVWGDTYDVEVIANFLYALLLYDTERFAAEVASGTRWVQDHQDASGAWSSTWYVGPFYGTYVCTRLLARQGDEVALKRARQFLIRSQRADGGWGRGHVSSQLSTALALCALAFIAERCGLDSSTELRRGLETLESARIMSCAWDTSPFICMNVGRVQGANGPILLYRSSAITAAYTLKAAILLRRLLS